MDVLFELSKTQKIRENPQLCIDLTDVIFIQDSLNENALRLKYSMLVTIFRSKFVFDIMNGGSLKINIGSKPNFQLGKDKKYRPKSKK